MVSPVVDTSSPIVAALEQTAGPDKQRQAAVAYRQLVAPLQPTVVAKQYPDQVAAQASFAGSKRLGVAHRPVTAAYASALDTTLSQVAVAP